MTIYISADTGNDSTGTGTNALPYLTIDKAHTMATSGDTIICKNSVASFTLDNQTFTKALTIKGQRDDASGAVFDAGNLSRSWNFQASVTISYCTFRGFNAGVASWSGALMTIDANAITFKITNSVFRDMVVGARNNFVNNGVIALIGSNNTGVDFTFSNNLIMPSVISNTQSLGKGTYLNLKSFMASTLKIDGNTIHNSDQSGYESMENFINVNGASGSNLYVRNNIIYSEEDIVMTYIGSNSSPATVTSTNNCRYGSFTQIPSVDTNAITADPMFVDKNNGNYNLRPASLCLEAGIIL